jgi:hypothetical protein
MANNHDVRIANNHDVCTANNHDVCIANTHGSQLKERFTYTYIHKRIPGLAVLALFAEFLPETKIEECQQIFICCASHL